MVFTFTNLYSYPIISICISFVLLLGLYEASSFLHRFFYITKNKLTDKLILTLFPLTLILIILQPIVLFNFNIKFFLFFFSYILVILSLIFLYKKRHYVKNIKSLFLFNFFSYNYLELIIYFLIFLYFLISLFPITDPDSLDYHIGIPLYILNNDSWPITNEWFTSRLAGLGEILITLGINFYSVHFAGILQFLSVLIIVSILKNSFKTNLYKDNLFFILIFLSSPVLLLLTFSIKPFLLPISMTTSALYIFINSINFKNQKILHFRLNYILILFFTLTAPLIKFNFSLSSGLIIISSFFYFFFIKKDYLFIFFASLIVFVLIYLPAFIFDYINYGSTLINSLFSIFPGNLPGYEGFIKVLKAYNDTFIPFPLSLALPSSLGSVTSVLGLSCILFIFLINNINTNPNIKIIFTISCLFFLFSYLLGQKTPRFFLEWTIFNLIAISFIKYEINQFFKNLLKLFTYIQILLTSSILIFTVSIFLPFMFNKENNIKLFSRYAYGYQIKQWTDDYLTADNVLLSDHRSIAIFDNKTISTDWNRYIGNQKEAEYYLDILKKYHIDTYLIKGDNLNNNPFFNCLGGLIAGPYRENIKTRNPFNSGLGYNYRLYYFKSNKLPVCYNIKNNKFIRPKK